MATDTLSATDQRKVERFHRTLADEWAYARLYTSDTERCDEYTTWLHTYRLYTSDTERCDEYTTSLPTYNHHRGPDNPGDSQHCQYHRRG